MISRKTIRFYDTPKDHQALTVLSNFKDYGFDNENQMVVSALCKFIEHDSPAQAEYNPEELANLIAEKLKGTLHITTDTITDSPSNESTNTSSSLTEMDIVDEQDTDALAFANDFINSL